MLGNMVMGDALVPLVIVGWEVGVNIVTYAEGDSAATEEGDLVVGILVVGAALVQLAIVGWEVEVNIEIFAKGDYIRLIHLKGDKFVLAGRC